jgi:hypothetical protein
LAASGAGGIPLVGVDLAEGAASVLVLTQAPVEGTKIGFLLGSAGFSALGAAMDAVSAMTAAAIFLRGGRIGTAGAAV